MDKAAFLDRDGTVIRDVGYLNDPKQIEFLPGSLEAIRLLNQAGYKVIIITNQAGVARRLISENQLQVIDKTLQKLILNSGGIIDGIYYCPHHPDHGLYPYRRVCDCRKPAPGNLLKAAKDHQIDLSQSWMIGDKDGDIGAGKNAGTKTAFVKTGLHTVDRLTNKPDLIADNLLEAVKQIVI